MGQFNVVIPPGIKAFMPSYEAGIVSNIAKKCGCESKIIDINIGFYNHIYKNNLTLLSEDKRVCLSSEKIEDYLKLIFKNNNSHLTESQFLSLDNEIRLRNSLLSKLIKGVEFGFFDIKFKNSNIESILNNSFFSDSLMDILSQFVPKICKKLVVIMIESFEQLYFAILLSKIYQNTFCKIAVYGSYLQMIKSEQYKKTLLNYFDCLIFGEAEITIPDIIKSYQQTEKFSSDCGIAILEQNSIKESSRKYSKIDDIDKYTFEIESFENIVYFYPVEKYPIRSSRDCSYGKCFFCIHKNNRCRIKRAEKIFKEIYCAVKKTYKFIEFVDVNVHANYLLKISDLIIKNKVSVSWIANTRLYEQFLDFSNCLKMKTAGCKKLFIGLESYDQKMLDCMNKGIKSANMKKILLNLKKAGIITHVSFLFGFPGETIEQAKKTQDFICDNMQLLDIIEINRFCNLYDMDYMDSYDVNSFVSETRNIVQINKKAANYFHIYKLLTGEM